MHFGLKKLRVEKHTSTPILSTIFLKPILCDFAYFSNTDIDLLKTHSTSDRGKQQYKRYTEQRHELFFSLHFIKCTPYRKMFQIKIWDQYFTTCTILVWWTYRAKWHISASDKVRVIVDQTNKNEICPATPNSTH